MEKRNRASRLKEAYDMFWFDSFLICKKIIKNEDEAIKIVADVFVSLYRKMDAINGLVDIKSFVFTTSRELALKNVKQEVYADKNIK